MENKNEQLQQFLHNNPNASKASISEGIDLKGLPLFNLLKKMTGDGIIKEEGAGDDKTYVLVKIDNGLKRYEGGEDDLEVDSDKKTEEGQQGTEETGETGGQVTEGEQEEVKSTSRDSSKYKFNGQEYGKGPLVRAVVSQYVADNPKTSYEKLKEVFPDTLLKRFGIFQDVNEAKTIGGKGIRYFMKPDQVIKLADREVVVCNQFTLDNIQSFLKVAKGLGYKIK